MQFRFEFAKVRDNMGVTPSYVGQVRVQIP